MNLILIGAIRFFSKMFQTLLGSHACCRFVPSCSEYAVMAIQKEGAIRGAAKAVWRIFRCHPLAEAGVDAP